MLADLLEEIRDAKTATIAKSRYNRVIGMMRGYILASGGKDEEVDAAVEGYVSTFRPREALYQSAIWSVSRAYELTLARGLSDARAYELLMWPIRNAYSGYLPEQNVRA